MTSEPLSYAVVTPVRNEAANIRRLAESLVRQRQLPRAWVVVDTGSTDQTSATVDHLTRSHPWIVVISLDGAGPLVRGGTVARAFELGFANLASPTDVVVKLDADTSFEPDYFERLLAEFAADPALGIASGTCFERRRGVWRERHVTGTTVWGASRAYRRACLEDVLPLEQRMGWDGVDEFRANARGWTTRTFRQLPFRHHRREGERDGAMWRARRNQGLAAHYLGYSAWYLILRSLWNAHREPSALAMIAGYAGAALKRAPQSSDESARAYLRSQQSLRALRLRAHEAVGRREP